MHQKNRKSFGAWPFAQAKAQLSEVFNRVEEDGPQIIKRRGRFFKIVETTEADSTTGDTDPLIDWLLNAPRVEGIEDADFSRDKSPMRDFDW